MKNLKVVGKESEVRGVWGWAKSMRNAFSIEYHVDKRIAEIRREAAKDFLNGVFQLLNERFRAFSIEPRLESDLTQTWSINER